MLVIPYPCLHLFFFVETRWCPLSENGSFWQELIMVIMTSLLLRAETLNSIKEFVRFRVASRAFSSRLQNRAYSASEPNAPYFLRQHNFGLVYRWLRFFPEPPHKLYPMRWLYRFPLWFQWKLLCLSVLEYIVTVFCLSTSIKHSIWQDRHRETYLPNAI